tara:strand:+ start:35188 stop:37392 length:2205 start_codon:yes stop_codon:yes gene_type:complete
MTFFLNGTDEAPVIPANNPKVDLPSWGEGLGAGVDAAQLTYNSNFVAQRRKQEVHSSRSLEVARRIGGDVLAKRMDDAGFPPEKSQTFAAMTDRGFKLLAPELQDFVMAEAQKEAELNPEAWADIDLTDEAVDVATNERLQAEYQDAQDILGMMQGGRGTAEFLGEVVGLVADVRTLPLFALGGSGSLARVIASEAAIGAGSEAVMLPSQFMMAEKLDIPDPNVAEQIAFGAAAGGLLGGGITAAQRGVQYAKGRARSEPIGQMDDLETEVIVDKVEDILTSNQPSPLEAISAIVDEAGEKFTPPPYLLENPINPSRPPVLPDADLIDMAAAGIEEAAPQAKQPKPKGKRPKSIKQFVVDEGGIWKGDDQGDIAALEYRKPGFVKKNQRVTSTAGDNGGGLRLDEMRQRAVEQGYLPPDATINDMLDALDGDIRGTDRAYSQADARLADEWDAHDGLSDSGPARDFDAMDNSDGRFFVPAPDDLDFVDPSGELRSQRQIDIGHDVRDYLEDNDYLTVLSEAQQDEIIKILQERGGDPELLIERMFDREADFIEGKFDNAPEDYTPLEAVEEIRSTGGPVGARSSEPQSGPITEGSGREGVSGGAEASRGTESTAAGEQSLIDGVAPITGRGRLQAAQDAPLRGGNAAADDGLFDVGARDQADMFSEPSSPEAQRIHEITANNMREEIEAEGDFDVSIETPDGGTRVMSARETLDYLDEGDAFSARLDLCGMGPN